MKRYSREVERAREARATALHGRQQRTLQQRTMQQRTMQQRNGATKNDGLNGSRWCGMPYEPRLGKRRACRRSFVCTDASLASHLNAAFEAPEGQNGDSGLSFQCQLMGSRVRYVTAHVGNMKLFHERPQERRQEGIRTDLTSEEVQDVPHDERLVRLIDRRMEPDGTWAYKWQQRNSSQLWVREAK
jgi:hypothetical protein